MKPLVLYHRDLDGLAAAWVCQQALGEIEAVSVNYGEPPPDVTDRDVYIVDFSYPAGTLFAMCQVVKQIRVYDHHKTAVDHLKDFTLGSAWIKLDVERAGCTLVWDELIGGTRPRLLEYVEDRDLWRFELPQSREVNAALASYPLTLDEFSAIANRVRYDHYNNCGWLASYGRAILRYQERLIESACEKAQPVEFWLGNESSVLDVVAANVAPYSVTSEVGNRLAVGQCFAVVYRYEGDRCHVGLRSDKDGVDVSEIAALFGGGGHKHAAGFECLRGEEPWEAEER